MYSKPKNQKMTGLGLFYSTYPCAKHFFVFCLICKILCMYCLMIKEAIESTTTFKYIRSLEATFESTPQAVLQLVYIMRTEQFGSGSSSTLTETRIIFFLSIFQSVLSMTNSILKDDNSRGMQGKIWKKYRKRFPIPSIYFLSHAISRLSQVVSRVGILALFWTVVGGFGFSLVFAGEILFVLICIGISLLNGGSLGDKDGAILFFSSIVVLPPELMFQGGGDLIDYYCNGFHKCNDFQEVGIVCVNYLCCVWLIVPLTAILRCGCTQKCSKIELFPTVRLGISLTELTIIILFGILTRQNVKNENEQDNYLFYNFDSGLGVFIAVIVAFFIDCCYMRLFPKFKLPKRVPIRSKWGLAFAGELTSLQKLKITRSRSQKFQNAHVANFWDDDKRKGEYVGTCAMYAMANKHYHVVDWLEIQGAQKHKTLSPPTAESARKQIDPKDTYHGWFD